MVVPAAPPEKLEDSASLPPLPLPLPTPTKVQLSSSSSSASMSRLASYSEVVAAAAGSAVAVAAVPEGTRAAFLPAFDLIRLCAYSRSR